MFYTNISHFPYNSRPTALQQVDRNGKLWFISSKQSHKNAEIARDDRVSLYFQNNSTNEFLVINGTATIHDDKNLKEKYWNSLANAWFDGKDDPNISIIEVDPIDSGYWYTKDGKIVSFIKMSFSAITGVKSDDGGKEGKLKI